MIQVQISVENIITQNKGNIASNMDGEKVLMSIKNGKYYNLGQIGGVIWDLIESPILVKNVIIRLIDLYDVEHSECEPQVLNFLQHLNNEGLIFIEEI
jgi:hypothetical protein